MKLHSLRYRIAATIFVLEAIMMTAVLWISLSSSFDETKNQIDSTDQVILKSLSELGRIALLTDEYNDFQPFIDITVSDPHTQRVYLTNSENIIYASSESKLLGETLPTLVDSKNKYWRSIEISNASGSLGSLWIHFSNITHDEAFNHAMRLGFVIAISGMIIVAIAGLLIGIMLTRRLDDIRNVAREYAQGNFTPRVVIEGDEEIKELGNTINQMADDINQTMNSLKESEEGFRTIFNSSNDVIVLIDPDNNKIININPAGCKMLEYEYDELLKIQPSIINPSEQLAMQAFLNEVLENGSAVTDELTCMTKSNQQILASISASKIHINGKNHVLTLMRNITEHKLYERELAARERQFRKIIESSPIAVCQADFYGNCIYQNSIWLEQSGLTIEQCLGHGWHTAIHEDDREETLQILKKNALKTEPWDLEYRFRKPDGEVRTLIGKVVALLDENNQITGYLVCNVDLTDYKHAEKALRRSQKMDAIGQLSGGIAHDFNNLLGAILGSIELLELQTTLDEKAQKRVDTVKHAAQHGVDLTKQLLGFSRKEIARTKATDINQLINNIHPLITHSLTPQVELSINLSESLWETDIEAGEFEDALINMVLNARDAMDGRGLLTIETRNTTLDENYCLLNPEVTAGEYIELAISDNGSGITPQQLEHIFEPFFTTKDQEKGTGLGLAMVFGFVTRSRGHIKVYSEPSVGTTMRLYLPHAMREERRVASEQGQDATTSQEIDVLPRGDESILVVDDEEQLLELVEECLKNQGYNVFTACDANLALTVLEQNPGIDLLISDVVMPGGLNGYELAEKASELYPQLKVLLTSGYTEKAVSGREQSRFNKNLLNKPYALKELMSRLIETLTEK